MLYSIIINIELLQTKHNRDFLQVDGIEKQTPSNIQIQIVKWSYALQSVSFGYSSSSGTSNSN